MSTELAPVPKEGFISKKPPQSDAMNFDLLRTLGLETIQEYSGQTWTDHNVHDPGITIMEILAYAKTELGIKANSPIEDLLASGRGDFLDLFKPLEALPSAAVTVLDYRKLLIDQNNIHNAWITKRTGNIEPSVFYDQSIPDLSYTIGQKVKPRGFYDVLIEFENFSLNTNLLTAEITTSNTNEYFLEVIFPYWDEIDSRNLLDLELQSVDALTVPGTGGATGVPEAKLQDEGDQNYFVVLEMQYTAPFTEDFGVHIRVTPEILPEDRDELLTYVDNATPGTVVSLLTDIAVNSLAQQFLEKNNESKNTINDIRSFIHNHRNLCEDFYQFKTVRTQEIGVNADIDITVGSNPELILAEIFFALDQFISPIIKFRSYDQMVALGYKVEEIFEGPLLNNGFLESSDLTLGERLDINSGEAIIYTSDLFNLIKTLSVEQLEEGDQIIDLRNVSLSNFINNQIVTQAARNCLKLTLSDTYKPKLNILKSTIRLFKEGVLISYDIDEVIALFDQKVADALAGLQTYPTDVLPIPSGSKLELEKFRPVQNDFPLVYGIGEDGLPENSTELRKAQAHQLKTYLAFFDQIYVNFLAQLNHIKELFSFNTPTQRTYFSQLLSDIPQLTELLRPGYSSELENIIEANGSTSQFERKNKFLSHLVARFGENPVDFRHLFQGDYAVVQQKLIDLKKKLLANHPALSSNRFKAYNYLKLKEDDTPDVWDTDNVSGYEKRVCHLLGLQDCHRRNLYNPVMSFFQVYEEEDEDELMEQRFRLVDGDGNILLSGTKGYPVGADLIDEVGEVISLGMNRPLYDIIISINDKYYFNLLNEEDDIIARRIEPFDTLEEVEAAIQEVIDFIGYSYIGEGFHLIEHLLLRPKLLNIGGGQSDSLLPVTFDNDSQTIFKDPYSFELTLIIPTGYQRDFSDPEAELFEIIGMERFRDDDFRRIMERVLRRESPAHAFLHIHRLDADTSGTLGDTPSLNNFERVFKAWLESLADPVATNIAKVTAQQELVAVLLNIYNPPQI